MKIIVLNNKFIKLLLAILCGIIAFVTSPIVINNIGNLNLILIITPIIILFFYYLARKFENYYLLALVSLTIFALAFVNIYVGLFFMLSFPFVYLVDEFKNKNLKDGLSAFAIILGVYLLAALWIQDLIPGYDKISLFTFVFNMCGVVLILFWIAWIQRGLPSARKALAFSLPALLLLLLWITYKGTGNEIFSQIHINMTNGGVTFRNNYIFKTIFFQSLWLFPFAVLKIFLLILGCIQLYKKQLGIIILFVLLMISCFWCFSWCKELVTVLNVLIAIISGSGVVKLIKLIKN